MFIQITPEGYTPDGKYAVIPRTLSPAAWKNLCNADVWPVTPKSFQRMLDVLVADAAKTPPPAEMLEEAKKKVLMPADMLAKARRALAHAASGNSPYQQDYDDFCAAIDAARGK